MKKMMLLNLGLALLSQAALAGPPTMKAWVNPECASGACEVKGIKLFVQKNNNNRLAGNFMSAELEASSPEALRKYGFVQYIQGCVFETDSRGNKVMLTRNFFGKDGQPFYHKTMEVDSGPDADPLYNSNVHAGFDELRGFEIPRNSEYLIGNPLITEGQASWAGKPKNLRGNKIYVSDYPDMAGFFMGTDMKSKAKVVSLNFKICLHKIDDVQKTVADAKYEAPNAITCMDWSSNYEYDFKTRKINEKSQLNEACK